MDYNKKVGKRINIARKKMDITMKELGALVNLHESTIQRYENGEIKRLDIEKIKDFAGALGVTPVYLLGWDKIKKHANSAIVPLIGTIAAGTPILAEQNIEDYFNIDSRIKADFALKIRGDSMTGAGISPGDIVFIRQQCTLENGEIGAILINNEATLKKFYKDNNTIILQAENDIYKPIIFTAGNVKILGKLIAVLNLLERK